MFVCTPTCGLFHLPLDLGSRADQMIAGHEGAEGLENVSDRTKFAPVRVKGAGHPPLKEHYWHLTLPK